MRGSGKGGSNTRGQTPTTPSDLVAAYGGRVSAALSSDLASAKSGEIFKWFLAAILFGGRISDTLAMRAYREFIRDGLTTPERILARGWEGLVSALDRGGYVRYDFKTATKLLGINQTLLDRYAGDLNVLHGTATDPGDVESRIKSLEKGIGDVTVNIFLKELRGVWPKATPTPSELVLMAAKRLNFIPPEMFDKDKALALLVEQWRAEGNSLDDCRDFEAALLRYGLDCRRGESRRRRKRRQ